MSLPKTDPSLPSGSSPLFTDVNAVRGDQLRANNGDIWDNLEYFDTQIDEVIEEVTGVNIRDGQIAGEYYVNTQSQFNAIIEEVSGNQWQFIDDVKSVSLGYIAGGYQMNDDDDYLETNNCKTIEMHGGAFLDFNAGIGYLSINTDDCYLRNVDIQGNGNSGAVVQSYLLGANRVTYDNCKCSNRLSSVDMVGFQGSGTVANNITSKYVNCSAYSLESADKLYGFKNCYNLQNCLAYDLDSTSGADYCYGFNYCYALNNCNAYSLIGNSYVYGFSWCYRLSSCLIDTISSISSDASGFAFCFQISGCYSHTVDSVNASGHASVGFGNCKQISSCQAYDIDGYNAYGFSNCETLSSCDATDIDSTSGVAYGFFGCDYGAALYTAETCNSCTFINANTTEYSCPTLLTP